MTRNLADANRLSALAALLWQPHLIRLHIPA